MPFPGVPPPPQQGGPENLGLWTLVGNISNNSPYKGPRGPKSGLSILTCYAESVGEKREGPILWPEFDTNDLDHEHKVRPNEVRAKLVDW